MESDDYRLAAGAEAQLANEYAAKLREHKIREQRLVQDVRDRDRWLRALESVNEKLKEALEEVKRDIKNPGVT
jgi:2-hydroxy-3-keto-5-methylthiopentenyl-1-phosphate phosphatase